MFHRNDGAARVGVPFGKGALHVKRMPPFRTVMECRPDRSIAIEGEVPAGRRVNAHITPGQETPDEIIRSQHP